MVWNILGESVTGTAHGIRNIPCQDAHCFSTCGAGEDLLVIVTADGAGSASHADTGAQLACTEFMQRVTALELSSLCTKESMTELFTAVRAVLVAKAADLDISPRDLACTVLLAIVGPTSATFAQLGDGAIVVGAAQEYRVIFWPEPSEYANATDFLTDAKFDSAIKFTHITDEPDEIAVLTDGLQRLALDFSHHTAYAEFFRPLFKELRHVANPEFLIEPFRNFLDSERVNARTDDDKTLVIATR